MTEFVELILHAFTLTAVMDRRQVVAGTLACEGQQYYNTHLHYYDDKCSSGKICCGYESFGK